jgi:hypothetical protein
LFADLGVKANLAKDVIAAIDSQYTEQKPIADKPLHVVLFAGHRVDAPGRVEAASRPSRKAEPGNSSEMS